MNIKLYDNYNYMHNKEFTLYNVHPNRLFYHIVPYYYLIIIIIFIIITYNYNLLCTENVIIYFFVFNIDLL